MFGGNGRGVYVVAAMEEVVVFSGEGGSVIPLKTKKDIQK
jgi:hypothetical protein